MKAPILNPDFIIDDIHKIREQNYEWTKDITVVAEKAAYYELLQDGGTGLYAELPKYVWNMLQNEKSGNIGSWMKV